jgi:hypothetical protein
MTNTDIYHYRRGYIIGLACGIGIGAGIGLIGWYVAIVAASIALILAISFYLWQ